MLWECAQTGIGELLRAAAPRNAIIAVGPEGGWEEAEVQAAVKAGFVAVKLGPRLFRTETAGAVAAAILQYLFGDLGQP
jgi:16S rRNA (uracil1498-N3)-methyltransferase